MVSFIDYYVCMYPLISVLAPKLFAALKLSLLPPEAMEFFINAVEHAMKERTNNSVSNIMIPEFPSSFRDTSFITKILDTRYLNLFIYFYLLFIYWHL